MRNLPTGVGMYRFPLGCFVCNHESPHRRGDVPSSCACKTPENLISPQAWGCTVPAAASCSGVANLPTGVGMYRRVGYACASRDKSPHRRGDVPWLSRFARSTFRISPQAWGCTDLLFRICGRRTNLPTGVGMYRQRWCRCFGR